MTPPSPPFPPAPPSTQAEALPRSIPAAAPAVPAWHIHRRMYDWVLSWAHHKHSTTALFLLSFAESSFFPIPPDVLQIALTLERRERAWWYATVSTAGSVLGGIAGWLIGWGLWAVVSEFFFRYIPGVTQANFDLVQQKFEASAFLTVFTAAFTPIPYKVFTIAAGVFHISLLVLIVGSIIGRGGRFFLVAGIFWLVGPPAKRFIERWFNLLTIVFTVLLVGGIVLFSVFAQARHGEPAPREQEAPAIRAPGP